MNRRIGEGHGRKPVDLISSEARGQSSGFQAIWEAIRTQRTFTTGSLWLHVDKRCGGNKWTIRSYVDRLLKGGYIRLIGEQPCGGNARIHVYELVRDVGVEAPRLNPDGSPSRQGRGRENMWRAMKILGEFDARDVAIHASTEETQVSLESAKDYVKHLHKAGYLHMQRRNRGPHSMARYRLLANRWSGPRPPQVQRMKVVFDPNLGRVVWPAEVRDES